MSLSLSSKRDLRWWVTSLPTACRFIGRQRDGNGEETLYDIA